LSFKIINSSSGSQAILLLLASLILVGVTLHSQPAHGGVNYDDPNLAEEEEASYSFPGFKNIEGDRNFDTTDVDEAKSIVSSVENSSEYPIYRMPSSEDDGD